MKRRPLLLIGLDAAAWPLIEELAGNGTLPTLARLLEKGCHGKLGSVADRYAGGVWPRSSNSIGAR